MNKKTMIGAMTAIGIGTVAFMMYKKKNPNFINDMKSALKDASYRVAYSLDENF